MFPKVIDEMNSYQIPLVEQIKDDNLLFDSLLDSDTSVNHFRITKSQKIRNILSNPVVAAITRLWKSMFWSDSIHMTDTNNYRKQASMAVVMKVRE